MSLPVSAGLDCLALLVDGLEALDEALVLLEHVGHVGVGGNLGRIAISNPVGGLFWQPWSW